MAKRFYGSMPYAGADNRYKMEKIDGGMLNEDRSAIANMPQDVKYHEWPGMGQYAQYSLNDNIFGVNDQMRSDVSGLMRRKAKSKY